MAMYARLWPGKLDSRLSDIPTARNELKGVGTGARECGTADDRSTPVDPRTRDLGAARADDIQMFIPMRIRP